jgi:hypothetical protein
MQGLIGVGTFIVAIASVLALNSWQKQRDYELGANLLAKLSEVQSRIRFYRLFGHLNKAERPAVRDQIYESGRDLEKLFHLAIATWDEETVKAHKRTLANVIDEFSIKSKTYEDYSDGKLNVPLPESAIEKAKAIAILDLWEDERNDEYSQRINSVVENIFSFVRGQMKG